MADITIRYATKDDCKELAAVIATVIQNTPYYNDLAKQTEINKFRSEKLAINMERDKYSAIIAIDENKIVGFCLSRFDDCLIWLQWFGILENCRKRNISNLLLNALEKTIALRGCHKIWCDCSTLNNASIQILTNHGYKQLVTIPNHWYGQDSILWEKEISLSVRVQPTVCQAYDTVGRDVFTLSPCLSFYYPVNGNAWRIGAH